MALSLSLWCTLVNPFVVMHSTHILVHRKHRLKTPAGFKHRPALRAGYLTQCDCSGICYILLNQMFRKNIIFHYWQFVFSAGWNGFAGDPCFRESLWRKLLLVGRELICSGQFHPEADLSYFLELIAGSELDREGKIVKFTAYVVGNWSDGPTKNNEFTWMEIIQTLGSLVFQIATMKKSMTLM